jgi:two-component system LytT family sensor kinase
MSSQSTLESEPQADGEAIPQVTRSIRLLLHPLVLLSLWAGIGFLFGIQNYAAMKGTIYRTTLRDSVFIWCLNSFINGLAFLAIWFPLRGPIQARSWRYLVATVLPLSMLAGTLSEMAYARIFPFFVQPTEHLTYWARVRVDLTSDWLSDVVVLWVAIFLARGIGYYEAAKVREANNLKLQRELTNAQLRALRMQLNPHFLFNTLNGISGLMRENVDRADTIMEQLCQLLRITLDRGDSQLIPFREEIDFIRLYLDIQCARFGERLKYQVEIPAHLYDVIVPTMILLPVVENAYAHGIAPSLRGGYISVTAQELQGALLINVTNSGVGLKATDGRRGIGMANVRARLRLHYGSAQKVVLSEVSPGVTNASLTLPLDRGQTFEGMTL